MIAKPTLHAFKAALYIALALTASALAQENDATKSEAAVPTEVQATEPNAGIEPAASSDPTPKKPSSATAPSVYNPTEEISEDLSVSFPIDI